MITLSDAVVSLRPGEGFVMRGEDIAGIEWANEGVRPLSLDEVQAEVARLEQQAIERREAALAKLHALGLTTDDLTALGL